MLQAPMFDGLPFYVGALAQDVGGAAEHRTFDWMKANASKVAPLGGCPGMGERTPSSTRASTAAGAMCFRLRRAPAMRRWRWRT